LCKEATAADVCKLGGGGLSGAPNHGVSPPRDPHDGTRHNETGDEALARLRSAHANKSLAAFNQHVDGLMSTDPSLTRSRAMDRAAREQPGLWAAAMGKSSPAESPTRSRGQPNNPGYAPGRAATMLPLSNDANSPRMTGPYQ
jgi:hypothetical protein